MTLMRLKMALNEGAETKKMLIITDIFRNYETSLGRRQVEVEEMVVSEKCVCETSTETLQRHTYCQDVTPQFTHKSDPLLPTVVVVFSKDTYTLYSHIIVPGKQNEWTIYKRSPHII